MFCEVGWCSFWRVKLEIALLDGRSLFGKFSHPLVLPSILIAAPVICKDACIGWVWLHILIVKSLEFCGCMCDLITRNRIFFVSMHNAQSWCFFNLQVLGKGLNWNWVDLCSCLITFTVDRSYVLTLSCLLFVQIVSWFVKIYFSCFGLCWR